MTQTSSVWITLLLAFFLANVPFLSNRLLVFIRLEKSKNLATRLAELAFWYFFAGGVGLFLEQRLGQIAPQGWEFYTITGTLFVTFAFPGFIYRYLMRHKQ